MDKFHIGIIVPTYRPSKYLYECLISIKEQTNAVNYLLIVILNGDKSPYFTAIESFLTANFQDNSLLLYSNRASVSHARNIGLDSAIAAGCQAITFVDDDDLLSDNFLAGLIKVSKPLHISVSNVISRTDEGTLSQRDYINVAFSRVKSSNRKYSQFKYRKFFSSACAKLIPVAAIRGIRFDTKLRNGEDAQFMFKLAKNIQGITLSEDGCIYYRRIRVNSASRKAKPFKEKIKLTFYLCLSYSQVYLGNAEKYEFFFYLSRVAASIRTFMFK